jgi:UDPglucose 6-dehydrogenase
VYDPMGSGNALVAFPELTYADTALASAEGADVIVVVTSWPEFGGLDAASVAAVAGGRVVVDACQAISAGAWRDAGWQVFSLTGVPAAEGSPDVAAAPLLPEP